MHRGINILIKNEETNCYPAFAQLIRRVKSRRRHVDAASDSKTKHPKNEWKRFITDCR